MKTAAIVSCFVLSALSVCAGVSGILDLRTRKNRWTSAPVALPAHRVPAEVRLSFVCRGPVEINGRILFTDAAGAPKGFYRFSPALKVPSRSGWNLPGSHSVCVPAYGIPEGAANARQASGGEPWRYFRRLPPPKDGGRCCDAEILGQGSGEVTHGCTDGCFGPGLFAR